MRARLVAMLVVCLCFIAGCGGTGTGQPPEPGGGNAGVGGDPSIDPGTPPVDPGDPGDPGDPPAGIGDWPGPGSNPKPDIAANGDFPRDCLPDGSLYPASAVLTSARSEVSNKQACVTEFLVPESPDTVKAFYEAVWEAAGYREVPSGVEGGVIVMMAERGTEFVQVTFQEAVAGSTVTLEWRDTDEAKAQARLLENRAIQSDAVTDPKLEAEDYELVSCQPEASLMPKGTMLVHADERTEERPDCRLYLEVEASPERVVEYYQFALPAEYYPLTRMETYRDGIHRITGATLLFDGAGSLMVTVNRSGAGTAFEFRLSP